MPHSETSMSTCGPCIVSYQGSRSWPADLAARQVPSTIHVVAVLVGQSVRNMLVVV